MRYILAICLLFLVVNAGEVEIISEKFHGDDANRMATFTGNVKVTRGADVLTSEKLIVYFNENKDVTKYEAIGNAKIDMIMNDIKYFGSGDILIYEPSKMTYTLQKKAFIHDKTNERKVYGDEIVINQQTGVYEVDSKPSEPVKFLFKMQSK